MATDPVISGPWPFGAFEGFLDVAPIHGRDNRGGGTRLARRNRSGGGGGVRRGSVCSDDMEGPRHAGYANAGKRIDVRHDCSNPPLVRSNDLEAKRSSRFAQPIF
jgi:hypothetical protein